MNRRCPCALPNPFNAAAKAAWPTNSLNYNPIITQEESDACPSTSDSAAGPPRTSAERNMLTHRA